MEALLYDFWLSLVEGEVIPEVANFKEGWEGEKKIVGPCRDWTRVPWLKCQNADHYTALSEGVDFNKWIIYKSSNFTNPLLPQFETMDIDQKSLPIIIGP